MNTILSLTGTLLAVLASPFVMSAAPGDPGGSNERFRSPADGVVPGRTLSAGESDQFQRGLDLFDHSFHRVDGLGFPNMNADSCRGCHIDPRMGGAGPLEANVSRFGRIDAGVFTDLPGGQGLSKLRPPFALRREEWPAGANVFEQRQTPTLFGLGLVDVIPDGVILLREDPDDADGDGIRGVARRIDVAGHIEIGRFGWKAQIPRLRDFVKDAMGGELGVTTPDDGRGFAFTTDEDGVLDPELTEAQVEDIFFFMRELPPPPRGGSDDPRVDLGEDVFQEIGCSKCHVPRLSSELGQVELFSDLLLHDVMLDDFRGMAEEGAGIGLYRTAPLWGIRHTPPYMHDGRGATILEAIQAHAGEASRVRRNFEQLPAAERQALLYFLLDL